MFFFDSFLFYQVIPSFVFDNFDGIPEEGMATFVTGNHVLTSTYKKEQNYIDFSNKWSDFDSVASLNNNNLIAATIAVNDFCITFEVTNCTFPEEEVNIKDD